MGHQETSVNMAVTFPWMEVTAERKMVAERRRSHLLPAELAVRPTTQYNV